MGHPWKFSFHFSFLIYASRLDSLDERSAHRKTSTYTGQHKHRIKIHIHIYIHASSRIRTYDPGIQTNQDSSCLRLPGGYESEIPSNKSRVSAILTSHGEVCDVFSDAELSAPVGVHRPFSTAYCLQLQHRKARQESNQKDEATIRCR
jgi:hypothetical protein